MPTRVRWFPGCLMFLLVALVGCGKPWYIEPPQMPHALTAVGVSAETFDPAQMRKQAELNARLGIARVLDIRVQEVLKDWARSRQEAPNDAKILETYFESVSRSILDMPLPNVVITKYHFDEDERRMYALGALDFERVLPQVEDVVKTQAQQQLAFPSREEVDAAFKELDAALKMSIGQ